MKRELAIVLVVTFALVALLTAPLATPYWWDDGAVYAPGAKWLVDHGWGAWPGAFPSDLSRGHTPLFYVMLAIMYRVVGAGPVAGHVLVFAFAWGSLVFTYLLARHMFDPIAGALAVALLVASPLFQTMSSMALPEIAMTALTAASFYAFAKGRIGITAILGVVLVLVKEVGIACPLAIAGALFFEEPRNVKRVAIALVPAGVLALFFAYQKHAEGWFVLPYHAGLFKEEHSLALQFGRVAQSIFVSDGRVFAVATAIALAAYKRFTFGNRNVVVAFGLFTLMNLVFFAKMFFLERYVLPVHVGVVVLCGGALALVRVPGVAATIVAVAIAFARRNAGTDLASGETTFRYMHAVRAHQALFAKLGADHVVLTDWPVTDELRFPFLGWVKTPTQCVHVDMDGDTPSTSVDRVIAVRNLGSYEKLQRKARERGFVIKERIEDGPAEIELWAP
ncbi:MAG TPA: glycosyltransferase family 39 protein [Polyangiaceae bacterium]